MGHIVAMSGTESSSVTLYKPLCPPFSKLNLNRIFGLGIGISRKIMKFLSYQ